MTPAQAHKIECAPGDWWGEQGCQRCGRALTVVSIWRLQRHFWTHQ